MTLVSILGTFEAKWFQKESAEGRSISNISAKNNLPYF